MIMGAALVGLHHLTGNWFEEGILQRILGLGLLIITGTIVYFIAAIALKATSIRAIKTGLTGR